MTMADTVAQQSKLNLARVKRTMETAVQSCDNTLRDLEVAVAEMKKRVPRTKALTAVR